MSGIYPIGNTLFIDHGQLSALRHEAGCTIYAANPDPVPAGHDAGVRVEISIAAVTGIQMAGATITGNKLFDHCKFRSVVEDLDLRRIQATAIVSNGQHIIAGCQI